MLSLQDVVRYLESDPPLPEYTPQGYIIEPAAPEGKESSEDEEATESDNSDSETLAQRLIALGRPGASSAAAAVTRVAKKRPPSPLKDLGSPPPPKKKRTVVGKRPAKRPSVPPVIVSSQWCFPCNLV